QHLLHHFSRTLVCTAAEARLLPAALDRKSAVLQNFLDTEYYAPIVGPLPEMISRLQPYIVFSGSMDYLPNVDAVRYFCQEALPSLSRTIPGLRFVVAGRRPSPEVMALQADRRVHVTGAVGDIRPYLQGAIAAVAPMRIAR